MYLEDDRRTIGRRGRRREGEKERRRGLRSEE
jgi:hypothetical protein